MAYYESLDIGVIILSNGEINSLTDLLAGMVPALVQWAIQYGIAENTIEPANIVKLQATPNPFTTETQIRYTIPELRNPTLRIYDASGRLVKSFRITPYALRSTLSWDGRDDQNRILGSGVYFVKLSAGSLEETKKVLLVR
jgi:flagellar hook assembly protein FlgD